MYKNNARQEPCATNGMADVMKVIPGKPYDQPKPAVLSSNLSNGSFDIEMRSDTSKAKLWKGTAGATKNDDKHQLDRADAKHKAALKWRKPDDMALKAPSRYINSLPSKGVRSMLVEALNTWLHVQRDTKALISNIIKLMHNASVMIDDVQDASSLRRGHPAAHAIFGPAQVLNSGLFMFVEAIQESRKLSSPTAADDVLLESQYLYTGQSWDLYWRHNICCPSEEEYFNMVDNKTGGMFRLVFKLLRGESQVTHDLNFEPFLLLLGRFFQVRDDYMNLQCTEYIEQKGFCEDFDEGKYSYPLVHFLSRHSEYKGYIAGIFRQIPCGLTGDSGVSHETKVHMLQLLQSFGTLESVLGVLKQLQANLEAEITNLERKSDRENPVLRLVLAKLSVTQIA